MPAITRVISALHFDWHDMADCIDTACRALELDGVELSWHPTLQRPHCTADDLDGLPALAERAHLSAHVWDNLAEARPDQAAAGLLHWLATARRTGVSDIILHGGSYGDQAEGIRRTRAVLAAVLPEFEKAGVVLNLENHYDYQYRNCRELFSQPWEFQEVLSLESPSLGICFDTGHANMTRNTAELLDALAPWLRYVHLADNQGIHDDHEPYGRGTVDWQGVLRRLAAMPRDLVICVEFPVREDRRPFQACMADLRQALYSVPPRKS